MDTGLAGEDPMFMDFPCALEGLCGVLCKVVCLGCDGHTRVSTQGVGGWEWEGDRAKEGERERG
jgi:hypothetical protein